VSSIPATCLQTNINNAQWSKIINIKLAIFSTISRQLAAALMSNNFLLKMVVGSRLQVKIFRPYPEFCSAGVNWCQSIIRNMKICSQLYKFEYLHIILIKQIITKIEDKILFVLGRFSLFRLSLTNWTLIISLTFHIPDKLYINYLPRQLAAALMSNNFLLKMIVGSRLQVKIFRPYPIYYMGRQTLLIIWNSNKTLPWLPWSKNSGPFLMD
jgi:hypothetical protein